MKNIGVLYVCTGSCRRLLKNSIRSLRETNPDLKFHVLSDRPTSFPFTWIPSWTGKASRRVKTRLSEYTPFDLTLFVDTDTVFASPLDLDELLGDADLAMALDSCPDLRIGSSTFLRFSGFTTPEEVDESLNLCGGTFPFFNSGVMLWRNSNVVNSLFATWHAEWLKYRRADQLALARALKKMDFQVKMLGQKYNFPVFSNNFVRDKSIYHLIHKERIAREANLWSPDLEDSVAQDVEEAWKLGVRAENQYLHIGQRIYNSSGSTTLVICPANDESYWRYCARGKAKFITDASTQGLASGCDSYAHKFLTHVGQWAANVEVPEAVNQRYDFVVVNGPRGYDDKCPGRELPIAWALRLAKEAIYVFDYNRSWERLMCDRYLGNPTEVIDPVGKGNAALAVFECR